MMITGMNLADDCKAKLVYSYNIIFIFLEFRKKSKCAVWISRSMENQLILLRLTDMVGIKMKKIKVNFNIKLSFPQKTT